MPKKHTGLITTNISILWMLYIKAIMNNQICRVWSVLLPTVSRCTFYEELFKIIHFNHVTQAQYCFHVLKYNITNHKWIMKRKHFSKRRNLLRFLHPRILKPTEPALYTHFCNSNDLELWNQYSMSEFNNLWYPFMTLWLLLIFVLL